MSISEQPGGVRVVASRSAAAALVLDLGLLTLLAAFMLLLATPTFGLRRLHIGAQSGTFSDQLTYVAVARTFADTLHLRPHILLSSALWRRSSITEHMIYQPGYFAVLGTSYRAFGFGVWQSLLPSLLGYLIGGLGAYLLAARAAGRGAGWLAALLFLGCPPVLLFTGSAMSDLTTAGAGTLALLIFLWLPERARPAAGVLLLCSVYLLRETMALLAAPMTAALVYGERGQRREQPALLRGGLFLGCAVAACLLLGSSPLCQPRVTTNPAFLLDAGSDAMYGDAARQQALSTAPPQAYLDAIQRIAERNWFQVVERLRGVDHQLLQQITAADVRATAGVTALGLLLLGLSLRCPSPLLQGAALSMFIMQAMILLTYVPFNYKIFRLQLYILPAALALLAQVLWPRLRRAPLRIAALGLALLLGVHAQLELRRSHAELPVVDQRDDRSRIFIESLPHDDRTLLVGPIHLLGDYPVRHHPVDVAYLPANRHTLRLMMARHRVGTVLLPTHSDRGALSAADLVAEGFTLKTQGRHPAYGTVVLAFQRP